MSITGPLVLRFLSDPLKTHFYYISTGLRGSISHTDISLMLQSHSISSPCEPSAQKGCRLAVLALEVEVTHDYSRQPVWNYPLK